MTEKEEKWALFWASILHPVIFEEIEPQSVNRYLKTEALKERVLPDGRRKKISLSTLRRKLNQYRAGGFKNLIRKKRKDHGKTRTLLQEVMDKAIELKKEQPMRSDRVINDILKSMYAITIPRSTMYRHFKKAGATKMKLGIINKKVRCRWTRDHTHDLWVGDFEDGPYVICQGEVVPTYKSAFIDCHSRYIVEARYYFRESFDILIDSLLRAWACHGKSRQIYVDNAKIYHANRLKSTCYELGIKLIHRPVGDPSPGGLIERYFQTCQSQFEAEVRAGDILSLDELNRSLSAWLEVSYHEQINTETGQSPKERYHQGLICIRHVDLEEVKMFFMETALRTVDREFSDIRLGGCFYKVDPRNRGDRVLVKFDPYSDMSTILLYDPGDEQKYLGKGSLYEREKGAHGQIRHSLSKQTPGHNYLKMLQDSHHRKLDSESRGIDYRKVTSGREYPFTAFVEKLAALLGRKGKLAAFSAQELEILKKTYNRIRSLNARVLQKAYEAAPYKELPYIISTLQTITKTAKETQ